MRAWLLALMLIATRPAIGDEAISHLLKGAQLFRAEKFSEALVEFRVAEKLGAGEEASWYAAAALVKLQRPLDAIETFAQAERRSTTVPDALLTYYRAIACYDAKLYLCADTLLASVGDRSGPRISEQVAKARRDIATLLRNEPSESAIDWYLAQGTAQLKEERAALAAAFFQEALQLSDRRKTPYRRDEAQASLEQARSRVAVAGERKP